MGRKMHITFDGLVEGNLLEARCDLVPLIAQGAPYARCVAGKVLVLEHHHREVNGHRDRTLGDLLEEFRLGRSVLVRRIRQMDDSALGHRAMHPCHHRPMSAVDMAVWIAEHDDHHLATVRMIAGPVLDDGAWC